MKSLDRALQRWRVRRAAPFVSAGDRLLDVGCHDRTLIDATLDRVRSATGIDRLVVPSVDGKVELLRGDFPGDFDLPACSFDCIALLAVLEHVAEPRALARECHRLLAPGGRVVATVPHPFVDRIIALGTRLRLLDGMAAGEHHGFDHRLTVPIFVDAGFDLRLERPFQLGLNRLFVFDRRAVDSDPSQRPA